MFVAYEKLVGYVRSSVAENVCNNGNVNQFTDTYQFTEYLNMYLLSIYDNF